MQQIRRVEQSMAPREVSGNRGESALRAYKEMEGEEMMSEEGVAITTIDPKHKHSNRMRVQSTQDLMRSWRSHPEGGHGHSHSMQTRWQGPGRRRQFPDQTQPIHRGKSGIGTPTHPGSPLGLLSPSSRPNHAECAGARAEGMGSRSRRRTRRVDCR